MPRVKITGLEIEKVKVISKEMVDELHKIIDCPRDYFILECVNSAYVMDGEIVTTYPFVEVAWFDRGQEIQDKVAKSITKHVQGAGSPNVDVIFTVLQENKYYENGEHF